MTRPTPTHRRIELPSRIDASAPPALPPSRQITLIGANGSGKSMFMDCLMEQCGDKAYCVSALGADFPEKIVSERPGSVDMLYARAIATQPYLKDSAVSEIDKLAFLLFADELEYLLSVKSDRMGGGAVELRPTRLDRLAQLWRRIFPGSRVVRRHGRLMFANESGGDLIPPSRLSQGEKAVLYYISAVLYAMPEAYIFVDSPSLFIHPAILNTVWDAIEQLRPDCTFVYDTVDVNFVSSRSENVCIWIRSFSAEQRAWDYDLLRPDNLSDDVFMELIGSRRPVLFIEGDATHSIDAKLYSLVFSEYSVRPLGSCDKVIEATRTFNDLRPMHRLESRGIVDRDRRTDTEIGYLLRKNIMVPAVAEVENIFLMETVVRTMARLRGRDPQRVFNRVKRSVMEQFAARCDAQALMHVRHRIKREVECKIDARFACITAMETHLRSLIHLLNPRQHYNRLRAEFDEMVRTDNYAAVLRVFNHKPALADCNVAGLLGFANKDAYIAGVLAALRTDSREARTLRQAVKHCLGADMPVGSADPAFAAEDASAPPAPESPRARRHKTKTQTKKKSSAR